MLRAIANFGKSGTSSSSQSTSTCSARQFLKQSPKVLINRFSTTTNSASSESSSTDTQSNTKSFEEKQAFFERFSNAYFGGDQLGERANLMNQLAAKNYSRDVILERIQSELSQIYGKNSSSILNTRFAYEILGHRNGVASGEFELFPQDLLSSGKFKNITANADLVNELHASNYLNLNEKETQTHVIPSDSHFSLLLDEHIPDEYVQELDDNQVCLFGFAKSLDQSDIIALLKANSVNYTAISFGECVLSLPAYTVLTFNTPSEANEFNRTFNAAKHTFDRRTIYSTTFQDSRKEHGRNRTLLVSGIQSNETFNDLLNFLSTMGSVMNFEIVQEPVHEALPSTEQVLEYLKKTVKEGDDSIIYEITDTSTTTTKIVEYPAYNPNQTFMRDATKVSEIDNELEVEKIRSQELARRELLPRLVLNTWDSESNAPAEYQLKNKSSEQRKLIDAVQNEIRHEFQNKQYFFVTYACRQQAEIAYEMLNSTGVYHTVLKKSTEHYHCDTAHQTSVFKEIKESKRDLKGISSNSALLAKEQDDILAQTQAEMRQSLIDSANSNEFSSELSTLLESEVIGKSKHGFEHSIHLKNEKAIGREFNTRITRDDLNSIANQLQDKQRENVRKLESLSKNEDAVLDLYRAKVLNSDFNKATHPYSHISDAQRNSILENVQEQNLTEFKQRQRDYLLEEQVKQRWVDNTREIIENKLAALQRDNKNYRIDTRGNSNHSNNENASRSAPSKEKEDKDQYYSPATEYSIAKKNKKYLRYVSEMQSLYDGEYTESMKDRIFRVAGSKCTDIDGNVFVSEEKGKAILDSCLTSNQKSDIEYYHSIYDVLPMKKITDVMKQFETAPEETIYMMSKLNLPTKIFDRSSLATSSSSPSNQTNDELVSELNKYVAGLGEVYEVQKDARGEEKIVMYSNEAHCVPLSALNIDEIAMLRDCLATYGLDAEAIEKEVQYFLQHGDYSPEIHSIIGSIQVDPEVQLEQLINSTGLSKAELESILNLDLEKNGSEIVHSLSKQKEEAVFLKKMGPTKPEDLIKTNTKLRNKDATGKYKTSVFKIF